MFPGDYAEVADFRSQPLLRSRLRLRVKSNHAGAGLPTPPFDDEMVSKQHPQLEMPHRNLDAVVRRAMVEAIGQDDR